MNIAERSMVAEVLHAAALYRFVARRCVIQVTAPCAAEALRYQEAAARLGAALALFESLRPREALRLYATVPSCEEEP